MNQQVVPYLHASLAALTKCCTYNNFMFKPTIKEKEQPQHHCAKILHCYEAQTPGELSLHKVGEIVTEVVSLEHGWCKVATHHYNSIILI